MYDLYKKKSAENVLQKWEDYDAIENPPNIVKQIKEFVPIKK